MDPEDELAALAGLDLALDELAAGRDVPTERAGAETAALATLAAELHESVPPPPSGAAERGREAFLARAAAGRARAAPGGGRCPCGWPPWPRRWSWWWPCRRRPGRPGRGRPCGRSARSARASATAGHGPVHRARLRLGVAESYLAAGRGRRRGAPQGHGRPGRGEGQGRPGRPGRRRRPGGRGPAGPRPAAPGAGGRAGAPEGPGRPLGPGVRVGRRLLRAWRGRGRGRARWDPRRSGSGDD